MPFEIGPVLRFESRLVAGRKAGYALRVVTGLALACLLGLYFWAFRGNLKQGASPAFTKLFLAEPVTRALCIIHLTIALLFAPAAAADAFSRERVRGMLASVLTTELSPWRIVLETYAARLIPGFTIWLSSIPITLFALLWCSLDPESVAGMEMVTLGSILLGVAIALGLSLWTRRTAPTLLWTYGLIVRLAPELGHRHVAHRFPKPAGLAGSHQSLFLADRAMERKWIDRLERCLVLPGHRGDRHAWSSGS